MKKILFVFPLVLLFACQNGRSQPKAEGEKKTAADNTKYYSAALAPAEVEANAPGVLVLTITPAEGYKWNKEYPFKFLFATGDALKMDKTEYKAKPTGDPGKVEKPGFRLVKNVDGEDVSWLWVPEEMETGEKNARLTVKATIAAAGSHNLEVESSFSVCNKTSCKIFRKEKLTLKVNAK